jgi:PAS domain S-box-containing protein
MKSQDKTIVELNKEIADLKESLDILRKSEEKFRKAYETSPDSININRLSDGMYVSINDGFTRVMGFSENEVIGKTSLELNIWLNSDERELLRKELTTNGEVKNFEAEFVSKEGKVINGIMSASLIDLNGVPHILSVTKDTTIRKKAEKALAKERSLIEALMNNLPDHIYFKDLESRFIRINCDHAKSFGLSDPSEAVGKSDSDFFTAEHALQAYQDEQKVIRTGNPLNVEEKLTWENRPDTWSSTTKLPLLDEKRNIIGIFGISRDITARKRAELEIQVNYEISQGITSTSNLDELLKLIHLSLGKVVYAENCFVALYDHKTSLFSFPYFVDKVDSTPLPTSMPKSCTAFVFRTIKPFLLTQEVFNTLVEQNEVELVGSPSPSWIGIPLQTPSQVIGVLVLQHYERENVYSESDLKFLISVGNQIAIAIERKISEEEIILKNELLQLINAEKDKFFSILAHDLRGPMSSFVAATEILTEDIQSMTLSEIRDITISMKSSASNIYSLLENLLEWSRLKRGVMEFAPEKLNLKKKISSCISVVSEAALKKKIEITVSVAEEIDIVADSHMFETVIRNLVSNAVKFTPVGGKISVAGYINKNNSVEIRIADSGIGMNPLLVSKLFVLGEKTSRQGTEGEPSSGLGLLLCKEIIEKHKGSIKIESKEGTGTTFLISFTGWK